MPDRPSFWNTLGWGAYLACSWTWCIGMFLPVLLIRDFGWWSFPVFAIPNCLGAAAMGWVLRRPGSSEAVVAAHGKAIKAFSVVTIAFQAFFWLGLSHAVGSDRFTFNGLLVGTVLGRISWGRSNRPRIESLIAWTTSVALLIWFVAAQESPIQVPTRAANFPGLAMLAPVCVFGFALSPYLDATFHKAARNGGGVVPARFGFGFLLFFPVMIGFTLLYASGLLRDTESGKLGAIAVSLVSMPVLLHIGGQLGFTISVHGGLLFPDESPERANWRGFALFLLGLVAFLLLTALTVQSTERLEFTYRLFMSFYGLVFPAYVWICMIPTLREPTKPTERQVAVWVGAVIFAAPFYYLGFIQLQYWALAPGVLIPLLARFAIGSPPKPNRDRQGADTSAQSEPRP